MRLSDLKENEEKRIKNLNSKDNVFLRRIEAMGLKKGEIIKIEKKLGRNIVVSLEGRKLAIDKKLADSIEVE